MLSWLLACSLGILKEFCESGGRVERKGVSDASGSALQRGDTNGHVLCARSLKGQWFPR